MSAADNEAFIPTGALLKFTRAIAVTNVSASVDLTTLSEFKAAAAPPAKAYDNTKRFLRLRADGADIFFGFFTDNTLTIDPANTTQGNSAQCDVVPSGQFIDVEIPISPLNGNLATFLYFITAAGTGKLRVSCASQSR